MATSETTSRGVSIASAAEVGGVFALAGAGIGATAAVALAQLGAGGGLLGGIIVLIVLTIAFLLAPVVGVVAGLRAGESARTADTGPPYVATAVGALLGYLVMMGAVLIALVIGMAIADSGGAGSEMAPTPTGGSSVGGGGAGAGGGGGLQLGQYIVPIVAVALPTVLTAIGGVGLSSWRHGSTPSGPGNALDIDIVRAGKFGAVGLVVLAVVGTGAAVVPDLLSEEPQVEVNGDASALGDTLYADGTVSNPGDEEVTTTLSIELVIDGGVVATTEDELTLSPGGEMSISWPIVSADGLTDAQGQAINSGNFEYRYVINGQVVETYEGQ